MKNKINKLLRNTYRKHKVFRGVVNTSLKAAYTLVYNPIFLSLAVLYVKRVATTGRHSNKFLKAGYLPVPVHYYSPIPDVKSLEKRGVWDIRSEMPGIDFNVNEQLALLKYLGDSYGDECKWPLIAPNDKAQFYLNNNSFSYGCAATLYCMIRHKKPKRVLETGSGFSSLIIHQALKVNKKEGHRGAHFVVDPFPCEQIQSGIITPNKLYTIGAEETDLAVFTQLEDGDILFIDSSHQAKIGSDVNFLFLEVLPRLKKGVIIHVHDINFPYDYPKSYALNESFRQFWTEQYLLQALLIYSSAFKILLSMDYLMREKKKDFSKAFSYYNPKINTSISGSFWMEKIT